MWCVRSIKLNDYLWEHKYYPLYERLDYSVYRATETLRELIESYYIETVCVPNKGAY